jgi:hypothetical protein
MIGGRAINHATHQNLSSKSCLVMLARRMDRQARPDGRTREQSKEEKKKTNLNLGSSYGL